ncbi:hypothetical protein SAMN05421830_108125 [Desulfomicrobium norvegicum]|uniref:Transposase DDE domain-containing protein n=1 Tax=Desulfomicrobium norvegicum (strain DSM 1741 / NCIMB 8310) TaxID=52561 RepID=A0A8G2C419_DESNO|nr:hypothetical protein SAMN05421830_108125 [Desulfomicrobium norvegicum]
MTVTKISGIIVGALSFPDNPFDGNTRPAVLSQVESIIGKRPTMAICDRGDSVNQFMARATFNFRKFIRILYFLCLKFLEHGLRPNVQPVQGCA